MTQTNSLPERVVFIVSTARTGTKALAEGLAGEGVESPHQPPWSRLLTCASNYYLHGWLPRTALEWLVKATRLRQIRASHSKRYIQVFALDHVAAEILHGVLPNFYVLHLVRDPRTFVSSYLNWTHTRVKSYIANKWLPGWHPSGRFTGDVPPKQWRAMDEFERVCWHWTYKNRRLEQAFSGSPRYMRLRFEDLMSGEEQERVLRSMLAFMGLPFEERFTHIYEREKNASQKSYFPPYSEWDEDKKRRLDAICGELMEHYGYTRDFAVSVDSREKDRKGA